MSFEIMHFRGSDKILKGKNMVKDVKITLEYIDDVLAGSLYKRELFRQALDEMDWRKNGSLNILDGRRYQYKGLKKKVAIEGNFSAYEYILEGLLRLQIGFDKEMIDTGILLLTSKRILLLTSKRSEKSPLGNSKDLAKSEVEQLYPTIKLPVSIVLYDLEEAPVHFQEELKEEVKT